MAGIYLHIPFCKQACHYCDFHFSTSLRQKQPFLESLHAEIDARAKELDASQPLNSIYFGGGTPSQLTAKEITGIIDHIRQHFLLTEKAEITLEANPDDLTEAYLKKLSTTAVNRLSIGIQSFREEDLTWMNRAHNATEAIQCIHLAQQNGFTNLTIDLIYGYPQLSLNDWEKNLQTAFDLNIPHISSYCLTVEPRTSLNYKINSGKFPDLNEALAAEHFELLQQQMTANGYEQYEISNFAKEGQYAQHNSSYWLGKPYLGLGPSAHSFDGQTRSWNVANNRKYINGWKNNERIFESEALSLYDRYNEYMLLGLRTIWGVDLNQLELQFGTAFLEHTKKLAQTPFIAENIHHSTKSIKTTEKGRLFADKIAEEFFWIEE